MLFTKLSEEKETSLNYPWVLFFDGKQWISLFPWMKEMQVNKGYDLYGFMPKEYASAERWIQQYLTNDEKILKHVGPDGDDTAEVLFTRFLEEELRKQGLSLQDIGVHRTIHKRQFTTWDDFPQPSIKGPHKTFTSLAQRPEIFAFMKIEIAFKENQVK